MKTIAEGVISWGLHFCILWIELDSFAWNCTFMQWSVLCNQPDFVHRKKQIDDIVMQLVDEQSDDSDDNPSPESPNKNDSGEKSPKEVFIVLFA